MKTPLPKFPHHRGVPEHHFGVKTPLLATLNSVQLRQAEITAEITELSKDGANHAD